MRDTATPTRGGRFCGFILARIFFVFLGCAAIVWGAILLPALWRKAALDRIASHIVAEEVFKPEMLFALIPDVEAAEHATYCRPASRRSAALIRLRIAEDTVSAGERKSIDDRMASLRQSVLSSLACSPADAFLWLVLFWIDNTQNGFKPEHVKFLRVSYGLGPNEGWVALKRNPIALSVFDQLPTDLGDKALDEFASLLNTGLYGETVNIFIDAGWRVRERLLPRLKDVAERHRQAFARALYHLGYDVKVPGVDNPDPRPWD